jgi:uncharacterized protein YpiB (UPF0302 family)
MNNEKSYSELVKSYAMNKNKKDVYLRELLIDMIIHESNLTYKKTQLQQRIDKALDMKDQQLFIQLSNEWNEVNKMFGT